MAIALARIHRAFTPRANPERRQVAHRCGEDRVPLTVGRRETWIALSLHEPATRYRGEPEHATVD